MAELPSRTPAQLTQDSKPSTRWYFEIQGRRHGPVDFRELRSMANNFKLLGHHQVWRLGSDERQPASHILGLIPQPKKEREVPSSGVSDDQPYAPPKVRTIADGPPGGLYLPHLRHSSFSLFLLILAMAAGFAYASRKAGTEELQLIFFSLSGICLIVWMVIAIIFLHRAWDMMRMFGAPYSGSKAIRFLFIPFFNALWSFVVLFGWSRLWNQSVKHHPGLSLASKVWRPPFFLFPPFFLITQALIAAHAVTREWPTNLTDPRHQISLGILGLTLLLGLACWFQLTLSINFLARKKS